MPPLYQDPLSSVPGAEWRWLDLARTLAEVACEGWVLALIALAVYSFLERDVKAVMKAFLPLAVALACTAAVALLARRLGGQARPVDAQAVVPLLRRAFPTGQASAVAAFATYTLLAYGRRAVLVAGLAVAVGVARALGGAHWAADLVGGGIAGVVVGAAVYAAAVHLFPGGHLARMRAGAALAPGEPRPGSP